ncbi:MAG: GGDEF domain-containing protein [Alphaproteobacteria bacterium]|nr:GGDEF domain-containing protein [Alphaproteobacteria bacterium]
MKITGNRPSGPAAVGTQAYKSVQRATGATSGSAAKSTSDISSVLGIPDVEFTPRVRDAIMTLMAEVDRLRQDLEQTKKRLESAETAADQDGLLPVLNRRAFVREMSRLISFGDRYNLNASLLYFDLDGFKSVNDSFGHAAGDAALHHVANLLIANVRESDIVGRLGGDEFGVILAKADQVQADKKAKSLNDLFHAQPFEWDGKPLALSFAYGVHAFKKGEDVERAMENADKAMYAAKREKSAKS